jgi:activator of HSP90 ATPase
VLNAPNGATEYVWSAASIPAGTSVIFAMSDAQNRTGGVSGILVSGSTGNSSCLNANSPSVTQQSTPSTQTSLPSSSASSGAEASTSKSSKISGLTLFAAIAGTLVFLGVVAALGVFLLRRCRQKSSRRRRADFDVDGKLLKTSAVPFTPC